jgi:hypothetical protein
MTRLAGVAVAVLCGLLLATPASAAPFTAKSSCAFIKGRGATRVIFVLGASARYCTAFGRNLHGRPFSGHVSWPTRCELVNPKTLAIMGVLTPNAAYGRLVCKLAISTGWIR